MRISDWSSDVCSSDLRDGAEQAVELRWLPEHRRMADDVAHDPGAAVQNEAAAGEQREALAEDRGVFDMVGIARGGDRVHRRQLAPSHRPPDGAPTGKAAWRERVCTYV